MRMISRPEISWLNTVNHGAVRRMIQVMENRSAMRDTMATARPAIRALACCRAGRRSAKMAIKMMLSMPSTISKAVRVTRAAQALGSENHSTTLTSRELPFYPED